MAEARDAQRLAAPPEARERVAELVERYRCNENYYQSPAYKEAQARVDFIDPFFEALGWDMANRAGYAAPYRDVVREDALRVPGAVKAPDYCFRIGGQPKFYVEAKKPSVSVKGDPAPAFQLRRYAWSAGLPLSILTDFQEFAVYDCRAKPKKEDAASVGRIEFVTYDRYIDRLDDLYSLFSKEAILRGAFDRYAADTARKRGTAEVDDEFLKEIEAWRDSLARDIARHNPDLSVDDLNFAVQATIDRILFLRIAEDRGVEAYGRLAQIARKSGIYPALIALYLDAEQRYDSGLFDFGRTGDTLTTGLHVSDRVLKPILRGLYYPDCPYQFSVISADILGAVYERFLGKVIRLTPAHHAKVEEKPEVRKAGGVYYTPKYIVDYIVEHTVGEAVKEAGTPKAVSKLRILDPACGSGSFLLGAYQYLLDWHLKWYVEHNPKRYAGGRRPAVFQVAADDWRLTIHERKRILTDCIFGVDLDPQAVEVTKLNLLLKCMEGETAATADQTMRLLHERLLPNLDANIKCGNSLIGLDYFEGRDMRLVDEEELRRVRPFDWKAEFPAIMEAGGFDCVIGNPPYLFVTEVPSDLRRYFQQSYASVTYRFDLYGAFIERAATTLLRPGGVLGLIIPHTLLSNDSFRSLRSLLACHTFLYHIVDLGPGVFRGARNETMLLFFRNRPPTPGDTVDVLRSAARTFPRPVERFAPRQTEWAGADGRPWSVHVSPERDAVISHMERTGRILGDLCTVNQGLRTGDNRRYLAPERRGPKWRPAAGGKDVQRYGPLVPSAYVYYDRNVLDAPRRPGIFTSDAKIVVQEVRNITLLRRIVATLDRGRVFCLQSTNVVNARPSCPVDMRYLLGVLNSAAVNFLFRCRYPGNNHIASNQLARVPVPHPADEQHRRMVTLVETMLDLHRRLAKAKTRAERDLLQRQIDTTDRQIDLLVYELYGLTDEEIAIVEEATKGR